MAEASQWVLVECAPDLWPSEVQALCQRLLTQEARAIRAAVALPTPLTLAEIMSRVAEVKAPDAP